MQLGIKIKTILIILGIFIWTSSICSAQVQKKEIHIQKLIREKKFEQAILILETQTHKHPSNLDLKAKLCHLYRWNQQDSQAITCYRAVLKSDPKQTDAMLGLAYSLRNTEQFGAEALKWISRVLEIRPEDDEAKKLLENYHQTPPPLSHPLPFTKTGSWKLELGGGVETFNYTSTAPSTSLLATYQKSGKYFIEGGFDFLRKFNENSYRTKLGGGYQVHPKLMLSDWFSFAPHATTVPEWENILEFNARLPPFSPYFRHTYRSYSASQIHSFTTGFFWYFANWGTFDTNYILSLLDLNSNNKIAYDQAWSARFIFTPIPDRLKLTVSYSRSQESFDAGNALANNRFLSHQLGGEMEVNVTKQWGLKMNFGYENRSNGQTSHTYRGGLVYRF